MNNESKRVGASVDREELRARLRAMTDNELRYFGRAVQKKRSVEANQGKTPREEVVIELEEATAEWKRRLQAPKIFKLPKLT